MKKMIFSVFFLFSMFNHSFACNEFAEENSSRFIGFKKYKNPSISMIFQEKEEDSLGIVTYKDLHDVPEDDDMAYFPPYLLILLEVAGRISYCKTSATITSITGCYPLGLLAGECAKQATLTTGYSLLNLFFRAKS